MLTKKQKAYLKQAKSRYNFKIGAARSGKTYGDLVLLPMRIRKAPKDGEIALIGYTVGTLCRNVLDPLRRFWGEYFVPPASANSTGITLFGRKCFLMGADKSSAVDRLRGCSLSYCYGDEVTTWSKDVFRMLQSRLDRNGSRFDGTANPAHPTHWLKRFLDSDADIYQQTYVIDDNPCLPKEFVQSLKREYAGTIWYDRLIEGKWVAAHGAIYPDIAADPDAYIKGKVFIGRLNRISVGVDFGGTRSATAFVAVGHKPGGGVVVIKSCRFFGEVTANLLSERLITFLSELLPLVTAAPNVYCDSAEPILIRTLKQAMRTSGIAVRIKRAKKGTIMDRIRTVQTMLTSGQMVFTEEAQTVVDALCEAIWDEDTTEQIRLDDGTIDIDSLDALEYALGL